MKKPFAYRESRPLDPKREWVRRQKAVDARKLATWDQLVEALEAARDEVEGTPAYEMVMDALRAARGEA